eukprot:NODE_405_length_7994_cov_0.788600.p9 type:complete len:103 gc:universal NODE_405_length_7994_cov_0.788600:4409-4101(-)
MDFRSLENGNCVAIFDESRISLNMTPYFFCQPSNAVSVLLPTKTLLPFSVALSSSKAELLTAILSIKMSQILRSTVLLASWSFCSSHEVDFAIVPLTTVILF